MARRRVFARKSRSLDRFGSSGGFDPSGGVGSGPVGGGTTGGGGGGEALPRRSGGAGGAGFGPAGHGRGETGRHDLPFLPRSYCRPRWKFPRLQSRRVEAYSRNAGYTRP